MTLNPRSRPTSTSPSHLISRQTRHGSLALAGLLAGVLTLAACTPMGSTRTTPVDNVDAESYLGTWYEVGSAKQFFSFGLVNVTANYQLNSDGSVRVENRGEYFFDGGPESVIVGNAVALDETFSRLNVSFVGPATRTGDGNYWIVDLDPEYRWAIVSDRTGTTGFLLSRTPAVTDTLYEELLSRAAAAGVDTAGITRTEQF